MKRMLRVTAGVLAVCCLPLGGCSAPTARDRMEGVKPQPLTLTQTTEDEWSHLADFGVRLMQNTMEEGKTH